MAEQFERKYGADPREDPKTFTMLTQECESTKRDLSQKTQVAINCDCNGRTLTLTLTRGDFERMTSDLLQRTKDTTELVIQQSGLKNPGQLDALVLVGGSTYMPAVESMLRDLTGVDPDRSLRPEKAVAQGAALHAAILEARAGDGDARFGAAISKRLNATHISDVNAHSLGVRVSSGRDAGRKINHIMIPKNTPIPYRVTGRFATTKTERARITVLEGEAADPDACSVIGTVVIPELPLDLPPGSPVDVTYVHDHNGQVTVSAREVTTGRAVESRIDRLRSSTGPSPLDWRGIVNRYRVE